MQVLKDEIYDRILRVATQLFYEQGFEKTSMRQIAQGVSMSVSNLYKYFKNKESIFDAVVKPYQRFYLSKFLNYISHEEKNDFHGDSIHKLSNAIFESIKNNHVEFVLLMDKSQGTTYASFKNKVMNHLEQHIRDEVNDTYKDEYIIKVFVRNFFYGIIEIAKHYKNDTWAKSNIALLVEYHLKGVSVLYS